MTHPGPSKAAEALAGWLIPPACREEVLGDLHERYRSPGQYAWDAFSTVPLVIVSRIRRTADPQVVLMQAMALYLSFAGAARLTDRSLLQAPWGLLRLATPAAMTLLGLVLEDAYARPGGRWGLKAARGPLLGCGLAFLSQAVLFGRGGGLALPLGAIACGGVMSVLIATAIRLLFPPVTDRPRGAGGPALWLRQKAEPIAIPPMMIPVLKSAAAILAAAIVGAWAGQMQLLKPGILVAAVVVLVAWANKR